MYADAKLCSFDHKFIASVSVETLDLPRAHRVKRTHEEDGKHTDGARDLLKLSSASHCMSGTKSNLESPYAPLYFTATYQKARGYNFKTVR